MTQTETIAAAIRSFDWAEHGLYAVADAMEDGAPAREAEWVAALAKHIREQTQGSRWQSIDTNPTTEESA